MTKQHFYGPVAHVAAGDIEHHYWPEPPPPDDPDKSTVCSQCGRLTWRHSQHCIHCHLDLFAWAAQQRRGLVRARLLRLSRILAGLGIVVWLIASLLSQPHRMLVFSAAMVLMMTAFMSLVDALTCRVPGGAQRGRPDSA